MKLIIKHKAICILLLLLMIIVIGCLLPETMIIPVKDATDADWNHNTFWHPWGKSGVHKGIDIFAKEGTPVLSACTGFVVYAGAINQGGNVVSILGPKWRIHYYAHMQKYNVRFGQFVSRGAVIGAVGSSGNAAGKPPHLHYSIISQIPYVWLLKFEPYGYQRMFYLNPHDKLIKVNN